MWWASLSFCCELGEWIVIRGIRINFLKDKTLMCVFQVARNKRQKEIYIKMQHEG